MKIKEGFVLRTICGQSVVSGEGLEQVNFSKLITLNGTAKFLWEKAQEEGSFTVDSLAASLQEKFPDVDPETIKNDCSKLVSQWMKNGLLES